jgi:putative acetyltransferase
MVAAAWRRRGVGTALLAAAEQWAAATWISRIELQVFPHNAAAIALYEQVGYEREGRRRQHVERAGVLLDTVLMARLLALPAATAPAQHA